MTIDTPRRLAIIAAVTSIAALALTAPGIPIVWDEGEYLGRADQVISWVRLVMNAADPHGGLHAFSHEAIREHWLFITYAEGHPAWAIFSIASAKALFTGILHPLTAARMGTIAVFGIACGAVAFRMRQVHGTVAATVSVVALITFPRMFSEAHFATLDAALTAWWLMLWAADTAFRSDTRSTIGVGVLAGLTSATKFTGWLAWLPLAVSRMFTADPKRRLGLFVMIPVALLIFFVVNPPLWHHPIDGILAHVRLSIDRANSYNIPITFLGRVYDMRHPLPWYNTIVWLVFATPAPLLVLGAIGVVHCVRRRDPFSRSLIFHWTTLMVIRALPGAPPHDGIRMFLPAFGFWCLLAGVGTQRVWDTSRTWKVSTKRLLVRTTIVVALAADAITVARYYPQTLSHYSLFVGGVRGAARMGMEPAYWWDALDADVLRWMNERTEPGAQVAFSPSANISRLREWGRLRAREANPREGVFKWYVLQNRTGYFTDADRALVRTVTPAYVKFPGRRAANRRVPPDLNVPLIYIFTGDEFKAAVNGRYGSR